MHQSEIQKGLARTSYPLTLALSPEELCLKSVMRKSVIPAKGSVDVLRGSASRRPQRKGPPQREREFLEMDHPSVRPEEHPVFVSVSKGVLARKSTVSKVGI